MKRDQGQRLFPLNDDSIALLFGNGTTIGQVCSYSTGLEEEVVEDVPGFCCMDAPYVANDWGEVVRIEHFVVSCLYSL